MSAQIFGYDFADIQRVQAKQGTLSNPVVFSDDIAKHAVADQFMLDKFGAWGLQEMGYNGVIDRLKRSGKL